MKDEDDPPMLKLQMVEPKVDFTPEQRLWLAVVVRAIVDYGLLPCSGRKLLNGQENPYNHHLKAATFLFAKKGQDRPASLGWIAEHLTDNPHAFIRCARRLAKRLYTGQQERLKFKHRVRHARLNAIIQSYAA